MSDPIGLIQGGGGVRPLPHSGATPRPEQLGGPSFKDVLMENLKEVNQLQQDASRAVEDLATGRRNDVETVLTATQKADTAFRMLLEVRNKVMDAYDEIRAIRV